MSNNWINKYAEWHHELFAPILDLPAAPGIFFLFPSVDRGPWADI